MAKTKIIKVDNEEYTLQFPGIRYIFELTDRTKKPNGELDQIKFIEDTLENVVISPKMTIESFDELGMAHLGKVVKEIETFLQS